MSEPTAATLSPRRLYRSRANRTLAGVCAGLADRFGMSRTLVRFLFVISTIIPGPQFLIYITLWILIPSED